MDAVASGTLVRWTYRLGKVHSLGPDFLDCRLSQLQWTQRVGNSGGQEVSVESFEELVEKELGVVEAADPPAENSPTSAAFDGIMNTLRKANG